MAEQIKVLVVDDSAVVRQTMQDIIDADPGLSVIGVAADPYAAVKRIEQQTPDVITLDIEMPKMDGLTFLRKLMSQHPIPVVICSSLTAGRSDSAIKAIEYGAVHIITKPKVGTKDFLTESSVRITDAIKAAAKVDLKATPVGVEPIKVEPKRTADAVLSRGGSTAAMAETTEKIVAVGASTGGTEALRVFLQMMPLDAPGIVVVQHMPENFTRAFANRMDQVCAISVKEAQENDTVRPGTAFIAPGNRHTVIKRSGARYYTEVSDGPLVSRHRPSVDVLFRSTARFVGGNAVGVIMTGMGDDGAAGMKEMHDTGAYTFAQDERTSVVYGMPKEAIKAGGVDEELPLDRLAEAVIAKAVGI